MRRSKTYQSSSGSEKGVPKKVPRKMGDEIHPEDHRLIIKRDKKGSSNIADSKPISLCSNTEKLRPPMPRWPSSKFAPRPPTRPASKRALFTASSNEGNSESTPAGDQCSKRSKRNHVPVKQSKEEKEINERKMEMAIKMAMETHNVVKSASQFGVATSTLRGRLKKLGYCPPPKPVAQKQAKQSSAQSKVEPGAQNENLPAATPPQPLAVNNSNL